MYKLYFWILKFNNGNFDDELSPVIFNKLLGTNIPFTNSMTYPHKILGIGSILQLASDNDIIWGTGIRNYEHEHSFKNLNVYCIRGYYTRDFLIKKNIKVPEVYGDPALLYSKIFNIKKYDTYENEIGFVPHYTQYEYYNKFIQNNDKFKNIKIINPTDNYKNVIENIRKSKYLISSSLHGLILADSFDIPNIMLYEKDLNEGTLKFKDYYSSQGRDLNYIKNLDEFFNININDYGNKVDLVKLENSFPKNIIKKNIENKTPIKTPIKKLINTNKIKIKKH